MEKKTVQTYRGVFLDIENSNICSLSNGLYFYFCSEAMKNHFEKYLSNYIKKAKGRIASVLPNINIENIDLALAIEFYIYVEKRGFRIETQHGVRIKKGHLIGDVEFQED